MQYARRFSILALAVSLTATAARGQAPAGPETAQSVAQLQSFGTMVAFLNLAAGTVRVVAILEPASPAADDAVNALRSLLESNSSKRLRAYVVWTRLSDQDTQLRALSRANTLRDRRLVQFWDNDAVVAESFRSVVASGTVPATGVVLLYDTDARLALSPPAPALWMSMNAGIAGPAFDPARLGASANTMVRRVEAKVTDVTSPKP
ncbi:MAG TPA: hypothetical protein VF247_09225 [Candidatus Krumholzibacteria bacterium]